MSAVTALSPKDNNYLRKRQLFAMIGRAVWINYPDIVLSMVDTHSMATTNESVERVSHYYSLLPDINKRHFIGVIIKIYHPHYDKHFEPKRGLIKNLSESLNMKKQNVSSLVKEVRVHLMAYEDFNNEVEKIKKERLNGCA